MCSNNNYCIDFLYHLWNQLCFKYSSLKQEEFGIDDIYYNGIPTTNQQHQQHPIPIPSPPRELIRQWRDGEMTMNELFMKYRSTSFVYLGRYHVTGEWFPCRIRSHDIDGTYTIIWYDGSLQSGTSTGYGSCKRRFRHQEGIQSLVKWTLPRDAYLMESLLQQLWMERECQQQENNNQNDILSEQATPTPTPSNNNNDNNNIMKTMAIHRHRSSVPNNELPATHEGLTVFEAAKMGNMEATLALIDAGLATPNDLELLGNNKSEQQGRTPLYWACFGGHVELVRALLERGGKDFDQSAYYAVTSRAKANDDRDLLFDPDTNTFTDGNDYTTSTSTTNQNQRNHDDDVNLIRAMLIAAKRQGGSTNRLNLPTKLFQSNNIQECIICLERPADAIAIPCGHISSCFQCLKHIHYKNRDGCPICRQRILDVTQLVQPSKKPKR